MKLWEGTRSHLPLWEYWWIVCKTTFFYGIMYRLKKLSGFFKWHSGSVR